MKKTLLAIGLAVAAMPLTFAAQAPANNSSAPAANSTTATPTVKKHVKKTHKNKKTPTSASTTAPKPASK